MIKDFVRRPVSRLIALSLTFSVLGVGMPSAEAASRPTRAGGAPIQQQERTANAEATDGMLTVFVQMEREPAVLAFAKARDAALAIDASEADGAATESAVPAGRNRAREIRADQAAVLPGIEALGGQVLFQAHRAVNGIAVRVAAAQMAGLRRLPGVKGVHVMVPKEIDNSTSVPFLGIPESVWDSTTGAGATGAGVSIAIIDTGIDYQHANFGGTGLAADYLANDRTSIAEVGAAAFPTAKVVGGYDFAGDAYTASNAPVPDADPMDCNGHGSHVAGTAAGWGVTGAGATFAGPYDGTATSSSLSSLRVGPGTAPDAELYALRVFGCTGSTNLTTAAIEWAMDPNGDDNLSDHLDVINMSLGSSFGSLFDDSVEASNNAAAAGIVVVASAGNSGDVYFITGAPGGATGAISVAASTDALPTVRTNLPGAGATLAAGTASFGTTVAFSPLPDPDANPGTKVDVVLANDGSGASATDGCCGTVSPWKCTLPADAWPNAGDIAGKIALVDRGTCEFAVKAYNAQINGAIGVILANNAAGTIAMGASAAAPEVNGAINVPTTSISQADGTLVKNALPGVQADMILNGSAGNTLASFSSRGPRRGWALKPDIAAPGSSITSAQTGIVCKTGTLNCTAPTAAPVDAFAGVSANSAALTISGTSMAAPHVAGMAATLKQLHPKWSAADLRALLISSARGDIFTGISSTGAQYGPGRVGGGLADMSGAVTSDVVLGVTKDLVQLSWEANGETFGTEITGPYTGSRTVSVRNRGTASHTYNVSYVPVVDNPGLAVSFPAGGSVTVAAKKAANLKVNVTSGGASTVEKTRDASVTTTQTSALFVGNFAREWQGEESGYIVLTGTAGEPPLRLALHVAPKPTAKLTGKLGSSIVFSGTDFVVNSPGFASGLEAPFVTPLEWQGSDDNEQYQDTPDPALTGAALKEFERIERLLDSADIREVGVTSDFANGGTSIAFGVATWGNWSTLNEVEFRVLVDNDLNDVPDRILFNGNNNRSLQVTFGSTAQTDSFNTIACGSTAGGGLANPCSFILGRGLNDGNFTQEQGFFSSQLFNNNVVVLTAALSNLGIVGRFNYWVQAFNREGGFVDQVGPFNYDPTAPGFDFNSPPDYLGSPWDLAFDGSEFDYNFSADNFTDNQSLGVLLLHAHNEGPTKSSPGKRSQGLPLDSWVSVGDASIAEGNSGNKMLNFTVSLNAVAPTGVKVTLQTADDTATAPGDYQAKTQSVTIPAGQTSKTFSVKIFGDTNGCGTGDDTGNETFSVNITNVVGAAINDGQGVGTIESEEPACP